MREEREMEASFAKEGEKEGKWVCECVCVCVWLVCVWGGGFFCRGSKRVGATAFLPAVNP